MDLKEHIRSVPDFPKPGILFYDISTLLAHPHAWQTTVHRLADTLQAHQPDLLIGIESRGFLVAAPLAYALGRGFAMIRKQGKLPGRTVRFTYDLEYGTDTIEIQEDAISRASGSSCSTICWRPGARCRPQSTWSASAAASLWPQRASSSWAS
jgi:adenine phosphoribosyltransferase